MSTARASIRRALGSVTLLILATLITANPRAVADGGCGPFGGGGTGCTPVPNPAPLTLVFSMPGRDDAVAVTVTLTRGLQQDRNGPPGSPPGVQVRTWETNPTSPRPPTLEEQGY